MHHMVCDLGGFAHRLQNAQFLVVRQHQRYHLRVVSSGQCGIQRRQIDHTLLVDEDKSGARTGIEYSRMLNSADESSRRVAQSHYYLVVGVPPLVNTTWLGVAPTSIATCARAFSTD